MRNANDEEGQMRIPISALAFAAGILPAAASGGLDCTADDAKVAFSLHGGVTRGMGGPLFQFEGSAEIRDTAVAADLRNTTFTRDHVAQYWFDAEDLRLGLYREREADVPHGYVDLVVRTKINADDGASEGTYEMSVFDVADGVSEPKQARFTGKVSCFTE